jgi:hypothetical protein
MTILSKASKPADVTGRLGFGCASLGSRVSATDGLAALELAFEAGVRWYDLAPSYGDGHAETIFSTFARRHGEALKIVTKVGIAPPRTGLAARLVRPLARQVVALAPQLRSLAARGRASAARVALTGPSISQSLDASLSRLGVDHIHALALHDPDPSDLLRDDVGEALQRAIQSGKIALAGIAGSPEAIMAGTNAGLPIGLVQYADGFGIDNCLFAEPLRPQNLTPIRVTHSHFSRSLVSLLSKLGARTDQAAVLQQYGYHGPLTVAARQAVLDLARIENADGILLLAAFKKEHFLENIQLLRADINGDPLGLRKAIT